LPEIIKLKIQIKKVSEIFFVMINEQIAQLSFLFKAKKDNSKAKHNNACG